MAHTAKPTRRWCVLNEVLSLNAQESPGKSTLPPERTILNEVLSLNAQEYVRSTGEAFNMFSSMKS